MIFQVLDADYTYDSDRNPLVQLFGSTLREERYLPGGRISSLLLRGRRGRLPFKAAEGLQALGWRVEEVERFEPIGCQILPRRCSRSQLSIPERCAASRERVRLVPGIKARLRDGYVLQEQVSHR